jgi:predicted RNase H-like HicB family nuclease/DNA-binding XRE family transcriptional regulator
MKYHFKVHNEKDGLWAECVELEGCVTQSENDTMDDLLKNMEEALNLYLDDPVTSSVVPKLPFETVKGKSIVQVSVHPDIAFSVLVRHYRDEKGLSQKEMMRLLGMNNVFSYQRLEKKGDPKLSTMVKLKKIFPDMSIDAIF